MTNFKYLFGLLNIIQEVMDDERIPESIREEYMEKFSDLSEKEQGRKNNGQFNKSGKNDAIGRTVVEGKRKEGARVLPEGQ